MILNENYGEFKKLYLTCFAEDSEEDAEFLFNTVFKKAECICKMEGHRPIAMLFLMDCNLVTAAGELPFYYLYAAATHPDFRGRGIMGELLGEAKAFALKTGRRGIFLKPATKSLFNFYNKYGFRPFFKIKKLSLSAKELEGVSPAKDFEKISGSEWREKRNAYLKHLSGCYGDFSAHLFAAATGGCEIIKTKNGGAVFEKRDELLLVKELIPSSGEELLQVVKALLTKTGCSLAEVRIPAGADIKIPNITAEDFSVIWCDGSLKNTDFKLPYHGFAFD